jgi:outer membrane protein assembly factor BamB
MKTVIVLFLLALQVQGDDWPEWRGPNRDGVWHETIAIPAFPTNGLRISWRVPVGRGWSSPIVASGRVYLTDVEINPPKAEERVLCLAESDGKLLWSRAYAAPYPEWAFDPNAGGPRSTPIARAGKLYTLGATALLHCLNAANGASIWQKDLAKEYQLAEFSGNTPCPLIEDDLLILYICGKPAACVVAIDKNSGKEIWRALDDTFTYSSPIIITAAGKKQLIVWTQQGITSLNPKTGETWWRETINTPGDMAVATPVFSNPWLLVGGMMLKLDADKPAAEIAWPENRAVSKRVLSNTSTALLQNGYIFAAKISGQMVCLGASTGKELWSTNSITDLKNGSSIHITPTGDSVLLFTNEGNLIHARLSPEGYQEYSRAHLLDGTHSFNGRNVVWPPPAYANGHVFARNDKELVCASFQR